jgi:hypothetical protein
MTLPANIPPSPARPWNPWLRAAVSLAIVWHLVGVMVAPLSVPPRFDGPPSVIGSKLRETYQPYMTALYLDHAYKFFAPNPGDSHLLRYDLYFSDGTKRINHDEQILPDRFRHWPRLLYHRHFMLTEFINDGAPPWIWEGQGTTSGAAAGLPGGALAAASATASPAEMAGEAVPPAEQGGPPYVKPYIEGIAAYLARRHHASRVDLYYRKHLLPSIENFREVGNRLDSPQSYRERLIASYRAEQKS